LLLARCVLGDGNENEEKRKTGATVGGRAGLFLNQSHDFDR